MKRKNKVRPQSPGAKIKKNTKEHLVDAVFIVFLRERESVKMMWGWHRGLEIYTDCISYSPEGQVKEE